MNKTQKKILITFFSLVVFSILHTIFMNYWFLNKISVNPVRYIKALIKLFPYYNRLSIISVLILTFSFVVECLSWGTFLDKGLKNIFEKKSDLYGSAIWLTKKILFNRGYIYKRGSGCVWGQTEDGVFKERKVSKKEREEIIKTYNKKIEEAKLNNEDKDIILDLEEEKKRKLKEYRISEVKEGKNLLGKNEFVNTMIIGGVGSCKTQGTIIPTLLSWRESVVVNDPKGELFRATAGYRSTFSDVYYIDPTDLTSTFLLNFFDWIPLDEGGMNAIKGIASILIPVNERASQPYFDRAARMVFEILCLDTLIYGKQKSIGELLSSFRADQSDNIMEYFDKILHKLKDPINYPTDEKYNVLKTELLNNIGSVKKEHPETFQSVVSTLQSHLDVFTDRKVISITNTTTISPEQFQKTIRPISIYITTPTAHVERNKTLINLIFSSIILKLTEEQLSNADLKNRVLFVLDEFFQLGFMDTVQRTIPIARGYGLLFMIAVQSISQIQSIYGEKEAISMFENFAVKDIKKVGEPQTADWVKSQIGKTTIVKERHSKSKSKSSLFSHREGGENISTSSEEIGRDLLTADEIMKLNYEDEILIISGVGSYKGKKIHSFEDSRFKDKMNLPFEKNTTKIPLFELETFKKEKQEEEIINNLNEYAGIDIDEFTEEEKELVDEPIVNKIVADKKTTDEEDKKENGLF